VKRTKDGEANHSNEEELFPKTDLTNQQSSDARGSDHPKKAEAKQCQQCKLLQAQLDGVFRVIAICNSNLYNREWGVKGNECQVVGYKQVSD